ncbi:DUF6538 domain-containing protein [Sphingomonas sp. SUN019]|uniref:DUF6538 domain-containing protein n=1 Tax=Sphingomonas sp. SUN019 TaxID=2937788 RepID=UPI0038D4EBBE
MSPKWPSGLWRRGAIYQYRTRMPVDLYGILGNSRIKRSLKTASLAVARRLVTTIASDVQRQLLGG